MRFYFVGIKGAGMCALCNIIKDLNYEVRGCDYPKEFFTSKNLLNIKIDNINNFKYINDFIYIIGNAYTDSSIAKIIKDNTNNYYTYPEFIEEFFRMPKIAISGTHGKTTTTFFLSQISNINANILCGDGFGKGCTKAKYLFLEACEYKNHFLSYTNKILLINNIELDHTDFFNNINEVLVSFQKAANNSQIVIVNGDCSNCLKISHFNIIRFGMNDYNDIKFVYKYFKEYTILTIYFYGTKEEIILPILAKHNIYNYVASYIIAKLIDSSDEYIKTNSLDIKLPSRRLQTTIINNSIVIDDYAHHPTEIKKTLLFIKEYYKDYNIKLFFQPHTFSRTKSFESEFINSLSVINDVYILNVFSSVRESGNENLLLNHNFKAFDEEILKEIGNDKTVYIFMGAGDINKYIDKIPK